MDDLARSQATLAQTFTPETIVFIKDRIDQQVPPIVHHLAEIATAQTTRKQIGGLIKHEVDDYYEQLSIFKKIFISRERIHREVDELVNKTLPRRVEEYLRGPAFEQEAETFLNATVDNVMARPLDELLGQFDSIRFEDLKSQISNRLIEILRSEALSTSVSMQVGDAIDRLRPQTLGALMQQLDSNSTTQAKRVFDKEPAQLACTRRHRAHDQCDLEHADRAPADRADWTTWRSRFAQRDGACECGARRADHARSARSGCRWRLPILTLVGWCARRCRIILLRNSKTSCFQSRATS
jgi:hypothetical protein